MKTNKKQKIEEKVVVKTQDPLLNDPEIKKAHELYLAGKGPRFTMYKSPVTEEDMEYAKKIIEKYERKIKK